MARDPKGSADGKLNIPQGTLELLILTIVRREPLHGYGGAILVVGVALAAGVLAARHATRTDPTGALRYE